MQKISHPVIIFKVCLQGKTSTHTHRRLNIVYTCNLNNDNLGIKQGGKYQDDYTKYMQIKK